VDLMTEPSLLMSTRDAFAAVSVKKTKGWELIGQGILKTRRIGRRVYVTRESVERLARHGVITRPRPRPFST
jgi:hypothetical protein